MEGVAQLHSAALSALAVHDGFCVTGSADCRLRVWGSDLQEVYMEARHEGAVTGGGAQQAHSRLVPRLQPGNQSILTTCCVCKHCRHRPVTRRLASGGGD